jgi:hypothetical protein
VANDASRASSFASPWLLERAMRVTVSFDLDDTLTSYGDRVLTEGGLFPRVIHRWLGEPLRRGTASLFRELRRRGCRVWIYTSSGRSPSYIRRWLMLHGIRVDGVVNGERHRKTRRPSHLERLPSKFPPAFGIDLHVDDSEGVGMEGDQHGFRVVVVHPGDERWGEKVLDAVTRLQLSET